MTAHLVGLLLGTEEDWPTTFEWLLSKVGPVTYRGETHSIACERLMIEPFRLRAKPRYSLVVDRLAWWYYVPREWLKKVALMDDVYLLNSPFTFQAMEKHSGATQRNLGHGRDRGETRRGPGVRRQHRHPDRAAARRA